jgi:hypothetical protein
MRVHGYSRSRLLIIDDVFTWQCRSQSFDSAFCGFKRLGCLYETYFAIVEHVAKHLDNTKAEEHSQTPRPLGRVIYSLVG